MRLPSFQDLSKEQDTINNLPLNGVYLVTGPPGTGKTVIALYRAHMLSERSQRVRLLMYSRLLSQYVGSAINELAIKGVVDTYHSWFYHFYRKLYRATPPEIERFVYDWTEILNRINQEPPRKNLLPHLLIDEGQDLPAPFYTVARYLSKNLTVFADENQTLTPNNSTIKKIAERLGIDSDDPPHRLGRWNYQTLERNYRNTVEIASLARVFYTGLKTGLPKLPERHGEKPRLIATNTFQQAVDFIARYQQNHTDREIGVFLPSRELQGEAARALRQRKQRDPSWTNQIANYVGGKGSNADVLDFDNPGIKIVNYKSAKGLEFDTVFIPELQTLTDDPDGIDFKMMFYVLISRARDDLYLMYSGVEEPRVLKAFPPDLVERQASRDETTAPSPAPTTDHEHRSTPAKPKTKSVKPAQPPKDPELTPTQKPMPEASAVGRAVDKVVRDGDGAGAKPPKGAEPSRASQAAERVRRFARQPVRDSASTAKRSTAEPSRSPSEADRDQRSACQPPGRTGDSGAKPLRRAEPVQPTPTAEEERQSAPAKPKPRLDRLAQPPTRPGRKLTLVAASEPVGPVVFLTNRYNLLDFLSSGMIVPQDAIPKYYQDLLALVPGRIPLLSGTVDQSLVDVVTSEGSTAYPVLLEIDPEAVDLVGAPGLPGWAIKSLRDQDTQLWAPSGAIPLSAVRRTHFRSQKELDEYIAREYENVPDVIAPTVSPGFFGEGAVKLDELVSFLRTVGPRDGGLVAALDWADRIAGARLGAIAGAPANVTLLRDVLRPIAPLAGRRSKKSLRQRFRLPARPTDRHSEQPLLPDYLCAALADRSPDDPDAEGMLFSAAVDVLSGVDRASSWRPIDVVQAVESILEENAPPTVDAVVLKGSLRAIKGILRNELDFGPSDDTGLRSAKALLMVLLRPSVEALLDWPSDESGADDTVQIAACTLAGLLRGRKRLPLAIRPLGLDSYLTSLIVRQLADDGLSDVRIADGDEATVDEDDNSVWISVGGTEIVRREKPPPALAELFAGADFGESAVREAAIGVCRELEWSECLSLVVRGADFAVKGVDNSNDARVVFPGNAKVSTELDLPRFMERIQSAQPEPELTRRVRERLKLSKSHAPAK